MKDIQNSREFQIGIISINMYSKGLNYACPLHTFAFQQFLEQNGIDSTVIDYRPNYYGEFDLRHPSEYYAKKCKQFEKAGRDRTEPQEYQRLSGLRDAWGQLYEERERRCDKFQRFIDLHYKKTPVSYDSDMLEVLDPGFDCYICCTDVIWRKEAYGGFDRGFFLGSSCMENKWKIAYAAGRGHEYAETPEDEQIFFDYLSDIDVISVREESLADYIQEKTGRDVPVVLDPVLLHEASFYDELLIRPAEEHYLFLYYVMEAEDDTPQQALKFARAHDLTIVEISERPLKEGKLAGAEGIRRVYRYDMGIEEWLGYIRCADYVFTNSFHCCCLSILFEKQFFAGYRVEDKVALLLARFGLSERSFTMESDLISQPRPDIDYTAVRKKLKDLRDASAAFILTAIRTARQTPHPVKDYAARKRQLNYRIYYNLGKSVQLMPWMYEEAQKAQLKVLPSGSAELQLQDEVTNDEGSFFLTNGFFRKGWRFAGWRVRVRSDRRWLWILEDGSLALKKTYDPETMAPVRLFGDGARIPYLPLSHIDLMVAEALWEESPAESFTLLCNSGTKAPELTWDYEDTYGQCRRLKSGSVEYRLREPVSNDGSLQPANDKTAGRRPDAAVCSGSAENRPDAPAGSDRSLRHANDETAGRRPDAAVCSGSAENRPDAPAGSSRSLRSANEETARCQPDAPAGSGRPSRPTNNAFRYPGHIFVGWHLRLKCHDKWYWLLDDLSVKPKASYDRRKDRPLRLLEEGASLTFLAQPGLTTAVLEAVWEKEP